MKLTLVRHTSLQIAEGICYGQSDIDVSINFASELSQLKQKLIHEQIDAVYASPLQRCSKLAYALGFDGITHDERLKELHFGDWEMQSWNDIPQLRPLILGPCAALALCPHVCINCTQRRPNAHEYLLLAICNLSAAQIDDATLQAANKVNHSENRVVLGGHRGKESCESC